MHVYVVLCISAFFAGAINAVAGGGTLLTFPALFAALGPGGAVVANATSSVALVPGSIAALWGYRREMQLTRSWSKLLIVPSFVGGLLGALLLVQLPDNVFEALVPWLILCAALLFALQPHIARWTGIGKPHEPATNTTKIGVIAFQFLVAVYGGYFGAGIGILMLSSLAMMGMSDIHEMNAVKTLQASVINGISAVVFIIKGEVHWPFVVAMAVAAIIGGFVGAAVARQLNRRLVREMVVAIGIVLASYYFYRQISDWLAQHPAAEMQQGSSSAN